MIQNINMPTKAEIKRKAIITRLQEIVKRKGFKENLGQKELSQYQEWLESQNMGYQYKAHEYQLLASAIDNLC